MTGIGKIVAGREAIEGGAGDGFVLRPALKGMWEVLETTRKECVVRV